MFDRLEMRRAVIGTWRLAVQRPDALSYFTCDTTGFWRSFAALLICFPAHMLIMFRQGNPIPADLSPLSFVISQFLIFVILWAAFALVVERILTAMDRRDRFFTYLVPYQWANMPLTYLMLLMTLVAGAAPALTMVAMVCAVWTLFAIARAGLAISSLAAVAVVIGDIAFGQALILGFELIGTALPR